MWGGGPFRRNRCGGPEGPECLETGDARGLDQLEHVALVLALNLVQHLRTQSQQLDP